MRILAILGCFVSLATANAQTNEQVKATIYNLGTEPAPYVPPQDAPPQDAPPPAPRAAHMGTAPHVPPPTVAARKIQRYIDVTVPMHPELTEQERGGIAVFRAYLDTPEGKELADLADTQLSIERNFHVVPESDIIARMNEIYTREHPQATTNVSTKAPQVAASDGNPCAIGSQGCTAEAYKRWLEAPDPPQVTSTGAPMSAPKAKKEHHKWRAFGNFLGAAYLVVYCSNLEAKPLWQYTAIDAQNLPLCRANGL
jgi:hypothetical protein